MGRMPEKNRRYFLKTKESKALLAKASEKLKTDLGLLFKDKVNVEVFETESAEIFLINAKPVLAKAGENIYPTLRFDEYLQTAPKVVVDMGAVPYVCNGANVMAPGIRRFEGQFDENDIVIVVDEKHCRPIAIGQILYDAEKVKGVSQGTVVRNVYYVGDKTWNLLKEIAPSPTKIRSER
jgi:PUA domain protein